MRHTFPTLCLLALGLLASCVTTTPEPVLIELENSGFEAPLDSGWTSAVLNDSNTAGYIERSDSLGQPDSGYAVRVFKFHKQFCSLTQDVVVDTLDQVATFDARFRLGGSVPCSPVAAVVFNYLDDTDGRLGRTMFYLPSSYNTWTSDDTLHLIMVEDTTGAWAGYSLNLLDDVRNSLPGVDPAQVSRLRVELLASVDYSG